MQKLNLIPELQKYNTVILADGEIPEHQTTLEFLKNAERIICCDGAVHKLLALGYTPSAIVGDCDSIGGDILEKFKDIVYPDKDTSFNDLNKAIRFCRKNGWNSIAVLGATGLRDDHFLSNISIFTMYSGETDMVMVTNFGIFTPIRETTTFQSYPKEQVSFFTFSPETSITLHNLRYPLHNASFHYFWEGSLNEAFGNTFTVEVNNGVTLVYRTF